MMTVREAVYRLKRMLKEVNADTRLSDRTVYSLLQNHAKWFIYRESEKLRLIKQDSMYQSYNCVDVIEAPAIDPCCGIKSDCTVYRTRNKIPELYEDSFGVIIKDIKTIDNQTSLTSIKPSEWERKSKNPWLSTENKNKFYFYYDGYVYFPKGSWKKVNILGLFKTDISNKSTCENSDVNINSCIRFLDQKFVIPEYLESQVFDAAIKDLSNTYKRLTEKSQDINKNDTK